MKYKMVKIHTKNRFFHDKRFSGVLFVVTIGLLILPTFAGAGSSTDKNWPCVQRKVPDISSGMIWLGEPLDQFANEWPKNVEISRLVESISARRTQLDKAKQNIVEFAQQLGAGRDHQLTLVASGMLETINYERARIIRKIEKFTMAQRKLGDRLENLEIKLNAFPKKMTTKQQTEYDDLLLKKYWFKRAFEQREQSLSYICQQPILLEQRAFALGRELMQHLETKVNQ